MQIDDDGLFCRPWRDVRSKKRERERSEREEVKRKSKEKGGRWH